MEVEPLLFVFLRFLVIAVLVTYVASRLRIPYTVGMVLVGVGASALRLGLGQEAIAFEPALILLIFLPGLLFEASYNVDLSLLRANLRTILLLAIPGVLVSTVLVGLVLRLILDLPLVESLLFGIMISATDPVAVVALFREMGVDRRLGIIVEGESLLNDGVAIVGFTLLVGVAAGSETFSLGGTVLHFVTSVAGGAILGLVVGFLLAELMRRTDSALIDVALTAILAYGTYFLAEQYLAGQVSPVIAVVVAGLTVGNYGARGHYSAVSGASIVIFWEFVVFLINSFVFLLIGLVVDLQLVLRNLAPALMAILTVLFARAIVVYTLWLATRRLQPQIPFRWTYVMIWGGLRGAVSIALVLSLYAPVEARITLLALVTATVLFSVVIQGLTIRPVLRRLGLSRGGQRRREFEQELAQMAAAQAAADAVNRLQRQHLLSLDTARELRAQFEEQVEEHSSQVTRLARQDPHVATANASLIQQEIGQAQKQSLLRLLRQGVISEEVHAEIVAGIEERLRSGSATDWLEASRLMHDPGQAEQPPESPDPD